MEPAVLLAEPWLKALTLKRSAVAAPAQSRSNEAMVVSDVEVGKKMRVHDAFRWFYMAVSN